MKRLVRSYAIHFTEWLAAEAVFVRSLDVELQNQHLFADALLEVVLYGESSLLHIEFQTYDDPEMEVRLQEYNVLASRQYEHRPVYSYVIYLHKTGKIAVSPLVRKFPGKKEVHHFLFDVIKLWEIPAEMLLQMGWIGLLPLVTLTRGGKRPEAVKQMIDRLVSAEEFDLLAISQVVGGLVFKKGSELDWFRRRFRMFQDILRESWVYQELVEEGREAERQRALERQRELLMSFVQKRFPEAIALAKQQVEGITDAEILQAMLLKLLDARTTEEVNKLLLEVDNSKDNY
jgi:predicted transposase YdaD